MDTSVDANEWVSARTRTPLLTSAASAGIPCLGTGNEAGRDDVEFRSRLADQPFELLRQVRLGRIY